MTAWARALALGRGLPGPLHGHRRNPTRACGILHNAYHLWQLGADPLLVTRLGAEDAALVEGFLARNQIRVLEDGLLAPGVCARIDVAVQSNGAARVTGFNPGVWADYRLTPAAEQLLWDLDHLHVVLTGPSAAGGSWRLGRRGQPGRPWSRRISWRSTISTWPVSMEPSHYVNIAFVGWQGAVDAPQLAALRACAAACGVLAIFTLGERGLLVCEPGAGQRFVAVGSRARDGQHQWLRRCVHRLLSRGQTAQPLFAKRHRPGCPRRRLLATAWRTCCQTRRTGK